MSTLQPDLPVMTLVDADAEEDDVMADQADVERMAQPVLDISKLELSRASLDAVRKVRQTFDAATEGDPAEDLITGLLVGEVGIAHELQSLEAAAVVLLTRTIDSPELGLAVAKLAREVVCLSSAVRRRTEGSLAAIAGLRAQRVLLARHRLGH